MSTELVLIVSDLFIPLRNPDIDTQFKSILVPNKIQHVICLGNIGNQATFDFLHSLSSDFLVVKGDYDINRDLPEKRAIQIGNFRIGMIHGHQIIPMGDLEILANVQRELDCDILASGFTHQLSVNTKEGKLYINPGSLSGALSPLVEDSIPSFILMALQGEEAVIYSYILSDKSKKFEVGQTEYLRGDDDLKIVKQIGEENNNENIINNEININNENNNNVNNNNEEKINLENEQKEENIGQNILIQNNNLNTLIQNENNEIKEADNKDEKIDE